MPLSDAKFAAAFRRGAECYLREYGDRLARERTAHFWLAICLASELSRESTHCIIGELHTRKSDLSPYLPNRPAAKAMIKANTGAFGFDLCISRDPNFDARSWQTVIKSDPDCTFTALSKMAVIAELKTGGSTTTSARSIEQDLCKLRAVAMATRKMEQRPKLFLVVSPGPTKATAAKIRADVATAREHLRDDWPRGEEPEIIMQAD